MNIVIKKLMLGLCVAVTCNCGASEDPLVIPLEYGHGTELLGGCENLDKFWTLMRYFDSQITPTYCPVASATMILNALDIPDPKNKGPLARYGTQEDRFFTEDVCQVIDINSLRKIGLTLLELKQVLETFGVSVILHYATDISVDTFRTLLSEALAQPKTYVIINYGRAGLGKTGTGHFSPIGAYNEAEDRALILDVNRRRLPPVWAKIEKIHYSMCLTDLESGLPRGFLVVADK